MKPRTDSGAECIDAGILENALVMIVVLGKNGKVLAWNHAAETITGYPGDEVAGNADVWKKLYPEKKYRDSVTRRIAGILKEKSWFEDFETTITTRSGTKKILLWNTKETRTQTGPVIVTVGQDVTRLRELDEFRTSVIENANVLITVIGPKGEVVLWNRAAEEITGYSREDSVGTGEVWKRLYPDSGYRKKITQQITGIIADRRYFENLETTIRTKNGNNRIISWNTRQIATSGGRHSIAIGRDITEQKEAEETLIAYMSETAMRIRQPIGIIRDNLQDIAQLTRDGKISRDEIAMLLDAQIRNAAQIEANVQEFQKAVLDKNREIPDAYWKFLGG
jgi:PAS domain S-box-containing protein